MVLLFVVLIRIGHDVPANNRSVDGFARRMQACALGLQRIWPTPTDQLADQNFHRHGIAVLVRGVELDDDLLVFS